MMADRPAVRNGSRGGSGGLPACGAGAGAVIQTDGRSPPDPPPGGPPAMAQQQNPRLLNPRIEALPTTRIAFVRHNGPPNTIEKTFKRFIEWCGDRGLLTPTTKYIGVA